jgi:protein dithiol:quinone oxidoreductase
VKFLSDLSQQARPWQILALSALLFELTALYFQYAMGLAPCIMCIYQRVAVLAIFCAGIIGSVGYNFVLARIAAYALWATGSIWGILLAVEHVEMQSATFSLFFTCEFTPNFPSWAPLHQWLPALFEATGDCGKISWEFLGYSMPQWMIVVYGVYAAAFGIILSARLIDRKMF